MVIVKILLRPDAGSRLTCVYYLIPKLTIQCTTNTTWLIVGEHFVLVSMNSLTSCFYLYCFYMYYDFVNSGEFMPSELLDSIGNA